MQIQRALDRSPAGSVPAHRIVVPVGGTDREFLAQDHAVEMAAALGLPVTAMHVRSDPDNAPPDLFRHIEALAAKWSVPIETVVLADMDPAERLLEELDGIDLLVIGSQRMGRRYGFGSIAEHLLKKAPCPVQVVRLDA